MCSQADDPSQHGSDDTLRAAAQTVVDHHFGTANHYALDKHECWNALRVALAASATDEPLERRLRREMAQHTSGEYDAGFDVIRRVLDRYRGEAQHDD